MIEDEDLEVTGCILLLPYDTIRFPCDLPVMQQGLWHRLKQLHWIVAGPAWFIRWHWRHIWMHMCCLGRRDVQCSASKDNQSMWALLHFTLRSFSAHMLWRWCWLVQWCLVQWMWHFWQCCWNSVWFRGCHRVYSNGCNKAMPIVWLTQYRRLRGHCFI